MFPWIASFRSQLTPVVRPSAHAWRRPAPFDRSPTAGEIAIDPTGWEIRNYVASRVEILKLDRVDRDSGIRIAKENEIARSESLHFRSFCVSKSDSFLSSRPPTRGRRGTCEASSALVSARVGLEGDVRLAPISSHVASAAPIRLN
jgi:hypothetical protein